MRIHTPEDRRPIGFDLQDRCQFWRTTGRPDHKLSTEGRLDFQKSCRHGDMPPCGCGAASEKGRTSRARSDLTATLAQMPSIEPCRDGFMMFNGGRPGHE